MNQNSTAELHKSQLCNLEVHHWHKPPQEILSNIEKEFGFYNIFP